MTFHSALTPLHSQQRIVRKNVESGELEQYLYDLFHEDATRPWATRSASPEWLNCARLGVGSQLARYGMCVCYIRGYNKWTGTTQGMNKTKSDSERGRDV